MVADVKGLGRKQYAPLMFGQNYGRNKLTFDGWAGLDMKGLGSVSNSLSHSSVSVSESLMNYQKNECAREESPTVQNDIVPHATMEATTNNHKS